MDSSETSRKEILELLANGKIDAATAADMLSAVGKKPTVPEPEAAPEAAKAEIPVEEEPIPVAKLKSEGKEPRWLRIRVRNLETGKNKVSINLPFGMFRFGINMARQFSGGAIDFDLDEMVSLMQNQEDGVLVDVQDEDGGEHVQIALG